MIEALAAKVDGGVAAQNLVVKATASPMMDVNSSSEIGL